MQVDRGCLYGIMAKQLTDGIEIITLIEEMGSEAVTKRMETALFG